MIVYFDYDNSHIKDIELYYNKIIKKTNNLINNNIAKNMKSFIQINFKDDINDYILCFLDYIFIITSKNHNLYSHINKYIDIIGSNYSTDDYKKFYELNIKQLNLLFIFFQCH